MGDLTCQMISTPAHLAAAAILSADIGPAAIVSRVDSWRMALRKLATDNTYGGLVRLEVLVP